MTSTNKLRVITPDSSSALNVLTARVQRATGRAVQAELQEIDHEDLIVELRLAEGSSPPPYQLALLIEEASTGLQVLSMWREERTDLTSRVSRQPQVMGYEDLFLPSVVRRAFDDRIPTASWQGARDLQRPHWLLAVPVMTACGQMVAGVQRRNGYSHRFTVAEATAIRNRLVA